MNSAMIEYEKKLSALWTKVSRSHPSLPTEKVLN